ncbi:RNA polymerase, subunit H/Rpb5 C-terminal [Pseudocohnilembus persalinus]|uniref:RNA polymerase, subunit H/Rpb5 C-terminal n=1 Tax=Pseudocohnilembus persalinus TaxID=266149 RepID=A0A0V0RA95_PSEPJ|nr:RNA polymerase, subunit H/Rpb5 C-terminal [Pseudocohnilembus persalinus]|eukprot:KRX11178.1 RNA polymerase, subunit H/Rpb5 C-terminal [Pseudocohnilembus persalinus]
MKPQEYYQQKQKSFQSLSQDNSNADQQLSQQDFSEEIIIDEQKEHEYEQNFKEEIESLNQIQFLPSNFLKLSLQNKSENGQKENQQLYQLPDNSEAEIDEEEHCIYSDDETSSLYNEVEPYINMKGIPSIYDNFLREFQQPNKKMCKPSHKEEIHKILELEEQAKLEELEKERIIQQQEQEQLKDKIEKYQKLENKKNKYIINNNNSNNGFNEQQIKNKQLQLQKELQDEIVYNANKQKEENEYLDSINENEIKILKEIRALEKLLQKNDDSDMLDVDEIKKTQKKIVKEKKKLDGIKNQRKQFKANGKSHSNYFKESQINMSDSKLENNLIANANLDLTSSDIQQPQQQQQQQQSDQNIYAKPNAQFYKKNNSKKPTSRQLAMKQRQQPNMQEEMSNEQTNGTQQSFQNSQSNIKEQNNSNSNSNNFKNKKSNKNKKNKENKEDDTEQLYRHVPHDYATDIQVFDKKAYTFKDYAKMAHLKEKSQHNAGYYEGLSNMLEQVKDYSEKERKQFIHNFTTQDDVNFFQIGPEYQSKLPKHSNCEMNAERIMNIRSLLIRKRYTSGIATKNDIEQVLSHLKSWFGQNRNQEEACNILNRCNYSVAASIKYMQLHTKLLKAQFIGYEAVTCAVGIDRNFQIQGDLEEIIETLEQEGFSYFDSKVKFDTNRVYDEPLKNLLTCNFSKESDVADDNGEQNQIISQQAVVIIRNKGKVIDLMDEAKPYFTQNINKLIYVVYGDYEKDKLLDQKSKNAKQNKQVADKLFQSGFLEIFDEKNLVYNITKHTLVPKHQPLNSKEKSDLLAKYKIKENQLPKILINDPVSKYFGMRRGDVFKIIRTSETAGKYITYRICM